LLFLSLIAGGKGDVVIQDWLLGVIHLLEVERAVEQATRNVNHGGSGKDKFLQFALFFT
jgi:hypothetical protein